MKRLKLSDLHPTGSQLMPECLSGRRITGLVDHPVETGDVIIVEAGEDHHTRSSQSEPLVAAWYLMDA